MKRKKDEAWIRFLKRHAGMSAFIIIASIVAVITTISVFLKVVAETQAAGIVPVLIGEWTVGYCFIFLLNLIPWWLAFVASWAIPLALIIYFAWYKKLPAKELKDYEKKCNCNKSKKDFDDGISFFCTIIWLIIVWTSGMWDLAFQEWTLNNWIYTWLAAFLWTILIVGIPGILYVIWSLTKK